MQVLTLLLSAARQDGPSRETDVLITQLPVPALWLSPDLKIRQVSRPFLEWFGLTDAAVMDRALAEIVPGQPELVRALEQAAAGRAARLPEMVFQLPDGPRPVRGETRPFSVQVWLGSWPCGRTPRPNMFRPSRFRPCSTRMSRRPS
ncbi:PAS domain-containing protein [Deinococcus malanensis]|uniref:PAS domain-containing protein n=1 Tax=Deinococcus malanensis TaxID=1706855 RepID=UPI00363F257E